MRFGLCTSDLGLIERADEFGLDYIDIGARAFQPYSDDAAYAPIGRRLRRAPVPVEAVGGFLPADLKIVGESVNWDDVRRYLNVVISRAAEAGVKVINWGSAGSRNIPAGFSPARAWGQLEQFCHLVADIAEPADVTIVIEPICPLECNVLYYVTDALLLAQTVNRPGIRVLADYYHMQMQNEPIEHIAAAKGWLAHAHTGGDGRHYPDPSDQWEQRRFLAALRGIGYDGRVSMECRTKSDIVAEVKNAVVHLRAVAAEL